MSVQPKQYDYAEVDRLTKAGSSAPEIAAQLGCTERTVVRIRTWLREQNGEAQPDRASDATYEQKLERARYFLEVEEWNYAMVAETLHMDIERLRINLPGYGWTSQHAGKVAAMVRKFNQLPDRLERSAMRNVAWDENPGNGGKTVAETAGITPTEVGRPLAQFEVASPGKQRDSRGHAQASDAVYEGWAA